MGTFIHREATIVNIANRKTRLFDVKTLLDLLHQSEPQK